MDLSGRTAVVTGSVVVAADTLVGPLRHREPEDIADGGQHVRGLHPCGDVAEAQRVVARPGR